MEKRVIVNGSGLTEVEHGIVARFSRVVTIPVWINGTEFVVYVGHTIFQSPNGGVMTDEGVKEAAKFIATAIEDEASL